MSESISKTTFVIKEGQEYCFLSNDEDPFEIFRALMEQAGERAVSYTHLTLPTKA